MKLAYSSNTQVAMLDHLKTQLSKLTAHVRQFFSAICFKLSLCQSVCDYLGCTTYICSVVLYVSGSCVFCSLVVPCGMSQMSGVTEIKKK